MDKAVGTVIMKVVVRKADLTVAESKDPKIVSEMPTLGQIGDSIEVALSAHFPGLVFKVGEIERTDS